MNEVWEYFKNAPVPEVKKLLTRRAGKELCRGYVSSMSELVALCDNEPEKLLGIRNIGEKGAAVILEVCALYKAEKAKEERA